MFENVKRHDSTEQSWLNRLACTYVRVPDASTECQVSVLQLDPRLYLCVFGVASTEICCSYGPNQKEQPQMVRNHLGLFFVSDILKLFGGFYEDHWRTCYGPSSTGDPESVCSCRNRT